MSRRETRKNRILTNNTSRSGRVFRIVCVIFVTMMIVVGVIVTVRGSEGYRFNNKDVQYRELEVNGGWQISRIVGEESESIALDTTLPYVGGSMEIISAKRRLPERIDSECYMYPHTNYQAIEVYVDGEPQEVLGIREEGEKFSDLPWTAVRITRSMGGKEIELRLIGYGDKDKAILYEVLLGKRSDIKWYLLQQSLNSSLVYIILGMVMVALLVVIAIINSRYKSGQATDFLYLAEYILLNLVWIFTDSALQGALFIGNRPFYYLNIFAFALQMIPFFLFLHSNTQRSFTRKVCAVSISLLIAVTIGAVFSMNRGNFRLHRMLMETHITMLCANFLIVGLLVYEMVKYKNKSLRLLLIGIGVSGLCGSLSLFNFYSHTGSDNTAGVREGTLILVLILCINGVIRSFKLITSGQAFLDLAEKTPLGICRMVIGKDEIDYANSNYYQMLGIYNESKKENFVHRKRDVIHPNDFKRYIDTVRNHVMNKDYHYEIEVRYVCLDGKVIWALENHEVDVAAGTITTTVYDITQRIKMEEQLREREEETRIAAGYKAEFLANMSHEIRTPMNVICGMAELLESCNLTDLEREYVDMIQSSANNLLGIVNDILDFSKIDSGKMELVEQNYSVRDLLYDIQTVTAPRISTKMLRYLIYVDPTIPSVLYGDSGRIRQILINILNNATKFTQKGEIALTVRCKRIDESKVRLSFGVRDTGIGIKDEDMDKLFTQFTRLDTKKNRSVEGTGLGLALSRELARKMNGDITVDSVYGEGSIFTATIEQTIAEDTSLCLAENGDDYAVLLLEEDTVRRRSVMDALKDYGIGTIYTDADAFMKVTSKYKVAIYDYSTFAMYMDMQEKLKDIFQIAMVEYGNKDVNEAMGVCYLQKPISLVSLRNYLTEEGPKLRQIVKKNMVFHVNGVKAAVVDDNRLNLKVADGLMGQYGLRPELISSGIELIKRMREGVHYDIIFLDHMMPEMDGMETIERIRKSSDVQWRNVPVIALTANAIKGMETEFIKAGMTDYLFKPIEKKALEDILTTYLTDKCVYEEVVADEAVRPSGKAAAAMQADRSAANSGASGVAEEKTGETNAQATAASNTADEPHKYTNETFKEAVELTPQIPGIMVAQALTLVGDDLETYYEVVTEYLEKVDENTASLMDFLEKQDIKNYTILIHALKSTSKLVGAMDLADKALKLEMAGHENNWDVIVAGTEDFVTDYQSMKELFRPYLPQQYVDEIDAYAAEHGAAEESGETDWDDETKAMLAKIKEQLENFEDEEAMEILHPMINESKNSANTEILRKIAMMIKDVEYDGAIAVIDEILL